MQGAPIRPTIQGVRYFLGHAPGLVRHGSKPSREIAHNPALLHDITGSLRSYDLAAAYPPNRAFLGGLYPDQLADMERPWFQWNGDGQRWFPYGEIMPEEELYGLLKAGDSFDLVWLEEGFAAKAREALARHPLMQDDDLATLDTGQTQSSIEARTEGQTAGAAALPLQLRDGTLVGCINPAHDEDASLSADVLL